MENGNVAEDVYKRQSFGERISVVPHLPPLIAIVSKFCAVSFIYVGYFFFIPTGDTPPCLLYTSICYTFNKRHRAFNERICLA